MNNKHLSWNKEINNNFIIASRAYFLQSPTCTKVNNLDHITMWLTSIVHIITWLTPIVHIAMWPTLKGFTRVSNLVHIVYVINTQRVLRCDHVLLVREFSQRVCQIQIRMYLANFYVYNALYGATLANCSHFQYVSRLRLRVIWIGVKACIVVTFMTGSFITSIIEKHLLSLH